MEANAELTGARIMTIEDEYYKAGGEAPDLDDPPPRGSASSLDALLYAKEEIMGDKTKGLYGKFRVERVDGKDAPGEKHHGCKYFVLDITHDPHAKAALEAYANSCGADYPLLAQDLKDMAFDKVGV